MNATAELIQACADWRQWTDLEAAGLHEADWPTVARCQAAKRALQPVLRQLREKAGGEWRQQGLGAAEMPPQIRSIVAELIALEAANHEILSGQFRAQERRRAELNLASRNLGRVHRSYGQHRLVAWQSYS